MKNNMTVMKYIEVMIFILIVTIIMIYLFLPQLYTKIVSGNVTNLDRAVVSVYGASYKNGSYIVEIKEKSELRELYDTKKYYEN